MRGLLTEMMIGGLQLLHFVSALVPYATHVKILRVKIISDWVLAQYFFIYILNRYILKLFPINQLLEHSAQKSALRTGQMRCVRDKDFVRDFAAYRNLFLFSWKLICNDIIGCQCWYYVKIRLPRSFLFKKNLKNAWNFIFCHYLWSAEVHPVKTH